MFCILDDGSPVVGEQEAAVPMQGTPMGTQTFPIYPMQVPVTGGAWQPWNPTGGHDTHFDVWANQNNSPYPGFNRSSPPPHPSIGERHDIRYLPVHLVLSSEPITCILKLS